MPADTIFPPIKTEDAFLDDEMQHMRAGVYELLGRLLAREPDEPLLELLRSIGEVDVSEGPIAMGWELMKQSSGKAELANIEQEYLDLFIGVGRGELVPFGSWYLTGFLMEKPVAILRDDLQRLGIEREDGVVESEDHVAALCNAMALIIREGTELTLGEQQAFFNAHVASWFDRFFNDLQGASKADFYRSVGFFGASFHDFEKQLLGMQS